MIATVAPYEAGVAAFALHALWQVPLLAAAAWCAVRAGRPHVRVVHVLWVGTLVLCVALPLISTVAGRHAARRAQRDAAASITFEPGHYAGQLPALRRQAAWKRLLDRHISLRDGLQPFAFAVSPRRARIVARVYLLLVMGFLLQFARAWRRMRLLVRRSAPAAFPIEFQEALRLHCKQLGLSQPLLRLSGDIAGPALAGVFMPVLLMPAACMTEMGATEWDAVLLHELAHLRRRDPITHAVCSLLVLLVAFHPVAWWVSRCIRQTREMACDAEAAVGMGSRKAYAGSLLRVAEKAGLQQHGNFPRGFFSNGLFGAGLELFNQSGAMGERMQMLVESQQPEARSRRAVRIAASVSVGALAVCAAGMLQVRPALAVERTGQQVTATSAPIVPASQAGVSVGVRLLSGDHAREQLRQARRELDRAEQQATNDEDRRKIATARGIAAAAERAMADVNGASSGLEVEVDLSHLQTQLSGLKMPDIDTSVSYLTPQQEAYLQSPEWKAKIEKQRAYFNSPEWEAKIEKQRAYFDSPEWKARLEKQHAYFNSPEWKERTEKQKEAALAAARAHMNSPEWKQQIEAASRVDAARMAEIARDARQQAERAVEQMQSAQRQMADAARLMAHNEGPPPMAVGNNAADPLKVPSNVMAGNNLTKKVPVYPAEAKEKKMQGEVLLHAIISEEGKVEQLSVINSPDTLFSTSAIEAVREWTYKPYLLNGQPVAVDTTITVHYSLTK